MKCEMKWNVMGDFSRQIFLRTNIQSMQYQQYILLRTNILLYFLENSFSKTNKERQRQRNKILIRKCSNIFQQKSYFSH